MTRNVPVASRRSAGVRLARLTLLLAVGGAASPARADLRDPAAWHVLVPQESIVDLEVWGQLLAGADDGGGVHLLDPATGQHEVLTTRAGLTSNRVSDLAVDDQQKLWVATLGGGIVSFDAARDPDPVTSLLDVNVTCIAADGAFVYYGTDVGVGQIVSGQAGNTFTTDDGLVSDTVVAVAAHDGTAWFGTPDGVSQFSRSENQFRTRNVGLDSPEALDIADLWAGPRGVFAATAVGVFQFVPTQEEWIAPATGLDVPVRALSASGDDLLALGENGVSYRLPPAAGSWTATPLDAPQLDLRALVGGPDGLVWYGGSVLDPTRIFNDPRAAFWHPQLAAPVSSRGLFGSNCRGLAPDGLGGFWVGTFPVRGGVTHWRSDGDIAVYNVQDDPQTPGTIEGWQSNGIKFAILPDRNGRLWVSEFTHGVTLVRNPNDADPSASDYVHLTPDNSPLKARSVLRIAEGPGGEIWFAGNGGGDDLLINQGIDILRNPDGDLFDQDNWLKLSAGEDSRLGGNEIKGITFGLGAVWLSVANVGIQRFDFDGTSNQQITFEVLFNDPGSWDTLTAAQFGLNTLNDPRDIRITPDGSIWLGANGQGVVRFRYDRTLGPREVLRVQQTSFGPSLLSNQVRSIELDRDGAVWAASDAGLNRITGQTASELRVDAWSDFSAFVTRDLPSTVISPLPGSNMWTLAYGPMAHRLFMATQTGAAALDLATLAPPAPSSLEVKVYPNPVRDDRARVRLSGFSGTVDVGIYNLLGVKLVTQLGVSADEEIWDTRDILDNPVASGLYLVRVSREGESVTQVLAVER